MRAPAAKRRTINQDFTLISNDCWGAEVYRQLGMPYLTPFVGLMLMAPDYIRLLENLPRAMNSDLDFIDESRFETVNKLRLEGKRHPIGVLDSGIEIQFLHYSDAAEAAKTWKRRAERMNFENLLVKFSDGKDLCTSDLIGRFERLPFERKLLLTGDQQLKTPSSVYVSHYREDAFITYPFSIRSFDLPEWLNTGRIVRTSKRF